MIRQTTSITYDLTYKNVKNINLRVKKDLSISVSAHKRIPLEQIDHFVQSKAKWIKDVEQRLLEKQNAQKIENIPQCKDEECLALFQTISDKIYPLFADGIKIKPIIKVRLMKSCWGVCHPRKNYITLNKLLMDKPLATIEYVILHEYIHFLHMNHQKGFYNELIKKMPDYKERKRLLR